MKTFKNILVATDLSENSEPAMEEGALLAKKFKANLYMMHVVDKIEEFATDYYLPEDMLIAEKNKLMKEARRKLAKKIAEMKEKYNITPIPDLRYGYVFDEIINDEKEKNIDLVVLAPRERKNIRDRFYTHLSDRIARNSVCDTLLIKQHA